MGKVLMLWLGLLLAGCAQTGADAPAPAALCPAPVAVDGEGLTPPLPLDPIPIAIPEFMVASPQAQPVAREISSLIAADLNGSGRFRTIDPGGLVVTDAELRTGPRFADWRRLNAKELLLGRAEIKPDGNLRVEMRLLDVSAGTQMDGRVVTASSKGWRRIAHFLADIIYRRATGEGGVFDSEILYVSEQGPWQNRRTRLAIMDQDGANQRFITDGSDMVLTPHLSPVVRSVLYLSRHDGASRVYLLHIENGQRELLGDFPGMTVAPRFSPDGGKAIFALASGDTSVLYEMDVATRQTRRLTESAAVDTAPSYAPDGGRIVFSSNREGGRRLYLINADGSGPQAISSGDGQYTNPAWSPRGDLIAFTKTTATASFIGVMRPDGGEERLLATGSVVDGAAWAPNGDRIIFSRQDRCDAAGENQQNNLYSIDVSGRAERRMATRVGGAQPSWSPLLP
jgi:TolB protein